MTCPLCNYDPRLKAQIESDYIAATISASDVADMFDDMDILEVLVHFEDHELSLEEEVERKKKILGDPQKDSEAQEELVKEYTPEPLPSVPRDGVDSLGMLYQMYAMLEDKLYQVANSKQVSGLGTITKELRETLREIERIKKDQKASMSDRTENFMFEHREMNRFLMYNLCNLCMEKYQAFLRGEFVTHAVDAHGQDGTEQRTDAVEGGSME